MPDFAKYDEVTKRLISTGFTNSPTQDAEPGVVIVEARVRNQSELDAVLAEMAQAPSE